MSAADVWAGVAYAEEFFMGSAAVRPRYLEIWDALQTPDALPG